jgi:hypothetical protein
MYYTGVYPHYHEVEMPQVRPMQQSLFPELSGTFRESESIATLNQEARHDFGVVAWIRRGPNYPFPSRFTRRC